VLRVLNQPPPLRCLLNVPAFESYAKPCSLNLHGLIACPCLNLHGHGLYVLLLQQLKSSWQLKSGCFRDIGERAMALHVVR